MNLGVFITTHLESNLRHAGMINRSMFNYYKYMVNNYEKLDPGIENITVHIMDTGSTLEGFDDFVKEKLINPRFRKLDIPNKGGYTASIKYLCHENNEIINNFDYFLFHIDDGVEVVEDGWAKDLIEKYEEIPNLGIMGRFLDTIRLGPTGLVDHRNCCSHIAKIWGITEITTIPHLHGDWWFMDKETLKELGNVWFDPVKSKEAMDYWKELESIDYPELARMQASGSQALDDMHIGREVDTSLRVNIINKGLATYTGNKIKAKQLHHRRSDFE